MATKKTKKTFKVKNGTIVGGGFALAYKEPDKESAIVSILTKQVRLKIIGETGEYYKLSLSKTDGYCLKNRIKILEEE